MTALPILLAIGAAAATVLPVGPAQAGSEEFTTKTAKGVTLNYSIEMTSQDADAFLSSIATTKEVMRLGLGIALPFDPVIQVRQRPGARRCYFTDGEDKIFFDFPKPNYVAMLQFGDERILRYSMPAFVQLWLFRMLTSTAGLDHRVLDSLVDYADYLVRVDKTRAVKDSPKAELPTNGGQVWTQIESVYPGTTVFILSALSSRKVPGHLLGKVLREIAIEATEDEKVGQLFDAITPPEPILSPVDLVPGAPVIPTSPLRPGRLALYNGTPLLDVQGDPISVADRMADFEKVFDIATLTLPQSERAISKEPPALSGLNLWPLYFEFRPRVLKASDNLDYYLVLREFLGRFKDRALALRQTPALPVPPGSPLWSSIFGLGFARNGDRIYVAKVTDGSEPAKAGITPGLEVVSIDGRPALRTLELLAAFTETFDSCPSHQRANAFALDSLLTGAKESECVLVLRDPDVKSDPKDPAAGMRTIKFKRGLPPPPKAPPATVESELRASDQVGVIRIKQFGGDALQRFAGALDELVKQGAKALVIDVRGNEGIRDPNGVEPISLAMLARLLPAGSGKLVVGSVANRDLNVFEKVELHEIVVSPAPSATTFSGPIAVLTDAWSGGESEIFVLGFQLAKRGLVVGTVTGGSVTTPMKPDPKQSLTRSRLELSFSMNTAVRPDSKPLQGIGITPQLTVEPDPADLKAGRDTVLERAAQALLPKKE